LCKGCTPTHLCLRVQGRHARAGVAARQDSIVACRGAAVRADRGRAIVASPPYLCPRHAAEGREPARRGHTRALRGATFAPPPGAAPMSVRRPRAPGRGRATRGPSSPAAGGPHSVAPEPPGPRVTTPRGAVPRAGGPRSHAAVEGRAPAPFARAPRPYRLPGRRARAPRGLSRSCHAPGGPRARPHRRIQDRSRRGRSSPWQRLQGGRWTG
jgi:hypothetical protein